MSIRTVAFEPFDDQRPGTSGLRKKTRVFQTPHYLASFVQAALQVGQPVGRLVVGGDGRYLNDEALQLILKIAAANGCERAIVGQNGLLSTPAASHLIRSREASLGIVLSASHNPAGPEGDFGVKINGPNGAPASEEVTEAIFALTRRLTEYRLADLPAVDLSRPGERRLGAMAVEVVDTTLGYADLMEQLFDFERIRTLIRSPDFRMVFDAMDAVTGPYAREIFVRRLGAGEEALLGAVPLPDFGGGHPDPNPTDARRLMAAMTAEVGPQFGAASDGDGDRHMIVGRGFVVSPSDSLAVMVANADLAPGYRGRLAGVARSMPTSRAVDRVAEALGIGCYETPTGWKYFGSLLDAGKITLCGEESAGAGSDHVREKDGLWAVLFWLNIVAATGQTPRQIVTDHWRRFGRDAAVRLDYEGLSTEAGAALMDDLRGRLGSLGGASVAGRTIEACDEFAYVDPVTGATAERQGIRLFLSGEGRIVLRLSGTGTSGATLRIYLEQFTTSEDQFAAEALELTRDLAAVAAQVARLETFAPGIRPRG